MTSSARHALLAAAFAFAALHASARPQTQSGNAAEVMERRLSDSSETEEPPPLTRAMLREVARRGPGPLLAKVEFAERPVFRNGRFVGLRILARHDEGVTRLIFANVRAGDVLTAVNGVAPRTPEDLATIVRKLPEGPVLTIEFLREGKPLRFAVAIVDTP